MNKVHQIQTVRVEKVQIFHSLALTPCGPATASDSFEAVCVPFETNTSVETLLLLLFKTRANAEQSHFKVIQSFYSHRKDDSRLSSGCKAQQKTHRLLNQCKNHQRTQSDGCQLG